MSECRNCGAPLSPAAHACHYCAAPGPNAGPVMGAGTAIELQAVGRNKIVVIKVVLTHALGVRGLKEAKDLVERPMPVRLSVDPTRARAALDAFTQAGAQARIVGLPSAARARIVGLTPAARPAAPAPPGRPRRRPPRRRRLSPVASAPTGARRAVAAQPRQGRPAPGRAAGRGSAIASPHSSSLVGPARANVVGADGPGGTSLMTLAYEILPAFGRVFVRG